MDLPPPYSPDWLDEVIHKRERIKLQAQRAATAVPDAVTEYLEQRTINLPAGRAQASVLYRDFINFIERKGWPTRFLPSQKTFSLILGDRYPKGRRNGAVYYHGLALISDMDIHERRGDV